jgi:hypothetical protein
MAVDHDRLKMGGDRAFRVTRYGLICALSVRSKNVSSGGPRRIDLWRSIGVAAALQDRHVLRA